MELGCTSSLTSSARSWCRRLAIETNSATSGRSLAGTPRVKMRREMVRGVEPEIQAFQDNDLYLSHARLDFIEPPEYEYASYRTCWQSLALDRCPVLLTSGSESAFIGSPRPAGEDEPKICRWRAGENDSVAPAARLPP